jgi:hypothetical protein
MAIAPLFLAAAGGCEGTATDLESDVGASVSALEAENGLTANGLIVNGFTVNGFTVNGLTVNGLTVNGLTVNGLTVNGLADPTVNQLVSYLVGCALPEGDSVTFRVEGQKHRFDGEMGLAPEWKHGPCRGGCQRWITACLLARVNETGAHVQISMRGPHEALSLEENEARDFPKREAAYYGNLFEGPNRIYACYSPGSPSIPRVCGDSLKDCPMNVVGPCNRACEDEARDGSFRECGDRSSVWRANRVYDEVITVFLRE